jgi:3D (Asp-Asp-Asp) domain-containing protein
MIRALITFYCFCVFCTGKPANSPLVGVTFSGTRATEGRTIACDPSLLGHGVSIEGLGFFICEDIGAAITGTRIDIFVGDGDLVNLRPLHSHERALTLGVRRVRIHIYKRGCV